MYFQLPMGIIGKVYANSVLVLLNSRMALGSVDDDEDSSIHEFHARGPATANSTLDHISEISFATRHYPRSARCSVEGRNGSLNLQNASVERSSTKCEDV